MSIQVPPRQDRGAPPPRARSLGMPQQPVVVPTPAPRCISADPEIRKSDKARVQYAHVPSGELSIGGMTAEDIAQGGLGDCYLLAALAAVAEQRPEVLERLIVDNGDGTYTVTFHDVGEKNEQGQVTRAPSDVEVTIDGDLPMTKGGDLAYGRTRDPRELWVGLVEKAWAVWKGGGQYEAISGGSSPAAALLALTGGGTKEVMGTRNAEPGKVFAKLRDRLETGTLMVAGTDEETDMKGLVTPHAYAILAAIEQNGEQYILLRNPWAKTEPYDDGLDDGTFLMPIAEFAKQFDYVDMVH